MEYPENKYDGSDTQKLISCDTSVDCSRKDDLKKSKVIGDCRKINQDSNKKNDCYKKTMEKVVESKDSFSVQCVGVKIQNSDISKVSSQDLDITIKSKRECEENLEHDKCDSSNVLKQKEHESYVKCVTDTCMLEKKGYYCEVSDVLCSEGLSSKNKINEETLEEADSKKDKIEEKLEGNNELSKVTGVLNLSSPEGQRHLSNLRKEIDILNEAGKLRPEYSSVCFGTPEKEVNQKEPKISLKRKDREEKNETCEKVQKRKKRKRQTIDTKEYEELLEGIDGEIDRVLEERAKRNRLTAANVKNILKHVITNEHVLSMVRNTMRSEEGVDSEIEEAVYEPKLTRSKVKELREKQGNLSWAFSPMKTSSMSKKLLEDDFSDDDSSLDDEYNPGMEIHNSDDDDDTESVLSSQASELGSPLPVHNASAVHSQENVDEDSTRVQLPDSTTDLKTEEDRIALRTRSKLPLIDTPLEAIEAAFVAPDITPDMYDSDCDDEEWRNFLNDFRKPLETCVNTDGREDEGEDPEYNFLEDDDILDKWDLRFDRAVKIPKREVQELMAEILQTTQQDLADGEEEEDRNTNNIPRLPLPSSALASTPSDTGTSPDVDGRRLLTNIHITDQMKSLLNQQMRMHVQLLTQMCLLSKDITGLERYSHIAFSFLEELYTFSQRQLPGDRLSVFKAQNLEESLRIVKCDDSSESKEILEPVSKYKKKNHRFAISDLVKQTLAFSNVFIYPELLPHSGFQCFPEKNKIFFTKAEDHLIALGLEQFLPLTEYPNMHAKLIQIHMLPTKNEQQIRIRIKNAKGSNTTDENPIKYYFKYHVAPPVAQVIKPFDSESVCAPCNLRASQVPKWMVPYLRNRRTIRPHPHVTLSAHCGNDISLSAGITSTTVPKFGYTSRICKTPEKKYVNNFLPRLSMRFSPRTPNKLPVSPLKQISPILKKYGHWSGRNTLCFPGTPVKNPGSSRSCRRTLAPKTDGLSCTILGSTINHNGHISPYVSPSDKNKFSPYSSPVAEYRPIAPKSVQTEKVSVNIHSSPDLQKLHYSNSSFTIPNSKSSDEKCIKNLPFKESNYSVHANSTTSVLPLDSVRTLVHENIEKGQVSQQISWNVETEWPNSVTTKACSEQTDVTFTCSALQNSRVISGDTNQNSLLGNSTCVDSQPSCSASQCNLAVTNLHSEDVPVDLDLGVECDSHIDVEPCDDGEDDGVDDEEDLAALMAASSTICRRNRLIRKKSKQQKELESTLALLAPNLLESDPKKEEKEMVFAQSYLMRVQEALKDEEKTYMKFLQVLCEYENCNNSPLQLYEDVSEILINHQTLVDEFVGFLLPEQARLCGRYDEYLNFSKIRAFLRKLEVHFSKQPQHLHRIVKALTQLQQTSDISSFKVRTTLQPLLRGQSHLVEEFLQLLPGKSPSESLMTDFEEILIPDSDAEETNSDSCEELKIPETEDCYGTKQCPCFCHLQFCDPGFQACKRHCSQCGTKFIDGRIYIQKGKLLKPAYVVYHTAPNSAELGKNLWTQRKNIDSPVSDSQGSESPLSSHCPSPGDCSYSLEETNEYDLQTGKVLNLKPAGLENGMSPGISASETGNEHLPIVQGFCADARTLSLNSNCDSASQDSRNLQSTQDPKNLQSKTSGSTFFVPGTSVSQTSGASDSLLLHIVDHQDVSLSDKPLPNSSNSSLQNISLSGQVFVDTSSSNLQKLSLVDHALIDSSSSNFQKMSPAGQTSLGTFSRNILNVSSSVQTLPHTSSISLQNRSVSGQTSVDALNKKLHYVSPCDHKTLVDISNSKVQNESQRDQKTSLDTSSSSFQNVSLCEQTDDVSRSSPQNVLVYDQISAIDTKSIQQTCENLVTGASSSEQESLVVDRDIKNATRNDQKQVPEQSFDCFTSGHKVISQEEVACIRSSKTETPKQTTQLRLLERSALVSCKKLENIFVSQKEENSMKPDVFKSAVEEHKWTREEDKVLLETCQKLGTSEEAFQQVIKLLTDKTMLQVKERFWDLVHIFDLEESDKSETETEESEGE